jgi:hypothetical protein
MRKETENTWEREGWKVKQTECRSKNLRRSDQVGGKLRMDTFASVCSVTR